MRVYRVGMIDKVQRLCPIDGNYEPFDQLGNGTAIDPSWQCPPLERLTDDRRPKLVLEDVSAIESDTSTLLFSSALRSVLEKECGISEQWFEANFKERPYSILNLPTAIEASDTDQTIVQYRSDGSLSTVRQYVFQESVVASEWLFKDQLSTFKIFCTDRFIQLIDHHGFSGLSFDGLWDSELPPFPVHSTIAQIHARPEVYGPRGFRAGRSEKWPPEWHEEAEAMKKRGEWVNY